jgi:hypothetical protein
MSDGESLEKNDTRSPLVRFEYTNDIIGSLYLIIFQVIILGAGEGFLDLNHIPNEVLMTFIAIAALDAVWLFGPGAVTGAKKLLKSAK